MTYTQNFIQFLQACITPVALISGVGLLLLTITNRLGRTIDRTRQLIKELAENQTNRKREKEYEIKILYQRSRYLRILGYILFILSILSILLSSLYFFRDVILSLHALKLEAREYLKD